MWCASRVRFGFNNFQYFSKFSIFFINDLYLSKKPEPQTFADKNTIASMENTIEDLIEKLETENKTATDWLKNNEMIILLHRFQGIIVKRKMIDEYFLNIRETKVKYAKAVTLLGIKIDSKLLF